MPTTRAEIVERLAMALPGNSTKTRTTRTMRAAWKKHTHSFQDVFRGAAEEIIRDADKLGLTITLKPKRRTRGR